MIFIAKKVKNEASPEKELKFHCKDCGQTLANEGKNQANQNNIARKCKYVADRKKSFKSKFLSL
jgi:transposase-like protein